MAAMAAAADLERAVMRPRAASTGLIGDRWVTRRRLGDPLDHRGRAYDDRFVGLVDADGPFAPQRSELPESSQPEARLELLLAPQLVQSQISGHAPSLGGNSPP